MLPETGHSGEGVGMVILTIPGHTDYFELKPLENTCWVLLTLLFKSG